MRLHLRLDSVTPEHIRQTVFFEGANCGTLCMRHGEYQLFGVALKMGADRMQGHLIIEIDDIGYDDRGEFAMPSREQEEQGG